MPQEGDPASCDPAGKGTELSAGGDARVDTGTDLLKNRVDSGVYQPVTVAQLLSLPWKGVPTRRYNWNPSDSTLVATYESAPVAMEGFIVALKEEGKEATNCGIDEAEWHDWHMWIVATEDEAHKNDKTHAIVVEITPRIRALAGDSTTWSKPQIVKWARDGRRVRVSGWLLFDPDHPPEVGKSRGTTWEVHPVMRLEPTG